MLFTKEAELGVVVVVGGAPAFSSLCWTAHPLLVVHCASRGRRSAQAPKNEAIMSEAAVSE